MIQDRMIFRAKVSIPQHILDRLGPKHAARRLELEEQLKTKQIGHGQGIFSIDRYLSVNKIVRVGLVLSGLSKRGAANIFRIDLVKNEIVLPDLPEAFEGFRILQLSDLHCDIHPELMAAIRTSMVGVAHDAVVLTGDYHNEIVKPINDSLEAMRQFIPNLHPLRFAILGNHDYLAKVALFEECGLPVLLNESLPIERTGINGMERIWICGVDDAHFFRTHDLVAAKAGIPSGEITILLSHTPETHREAAVLGYHVHLSGHTHGGQICLPGGISVVNNAPGCRREHIAGPWREGQMIGYTSRGTGAAGVPARFNCPPEMTLHTLTRGI